MSTRSRRRRCSALWACGLAMLLFAVAGCIVAGCVEDPDPAPTVEAVGPSVAWVGPVLSEEGGGSSAAEATGARPKHDDDENCTTFEGRLITARGTYAGDVEVSVDGPDILIELLAAPTFELFATQGVLHELTKHGCTPLSILAFLESEELTGAATTSFRVSSSMLAASCKRPLGLFLSVRVGREGYAGGEDAWIEPLQEGEQACPFSNRLALCCDEDDD